MVFVSVGLVDSARMGGVGLDRGTGGPTTQANLERYAALAEGLGVHAEYRFVLGTDVVAGTRGHL
jgi:hypothetical protein